MHARETLAHSLVIVPTMYLLAAVLLGIVIPAIDRSGTGGGLLGVTPGEAQSILESIAAGMIAFSGLVVSVAVLVVQFGAGQYSPRLVPSFRSDAVIKNALGLFVAPGVYALVAVANLGGSSQGSSRHGNRVGRACADGRRAGCAVSVHWPAVGSHAAAQDLRPTAGWIRARGRGRLSAAGRRGYRAASSCRRRR